MEQKQPVYTITRSYAEKISNEYHGGMKFETSDFFASHSYSFYHEPTEDEIENAAKILFDRCKKEVESVKQAKINALQGHKDIKTKVKDGAEGQAAEDFALGDIRP